MEKKGSIKIRGIDPGTENIGVSEWTLDWDSDREIKVKAYIDDFFTIKVPKGRNWNKDNRLVWIFDWFDNAAKSFETGDILAIEDVPYVQNTKITGTLHEAMAAILIPHIRKGYEIKRYTTPSWKARAVGPGNGSMKKHELMHWALGGNLPVDKEDLSEDSVDALCIGLAAMKEVSGIIGFNLKTFEQRMKVMN